MDVRNQPNGGKATIHSVSDESLLDIVEYYRKDSWIWYESRLQWYRVVPAHVCRRWRQLIITSPKRLHLAIFYKIGSPIPEILQSSPELPLKIAFELKKGESPTPKDQADVLLALGHPERVAEIRFRAPPELLVQLLSTINQPAPLLEELQVICSSTHLYLPDTLLAGNVLGLRKLHLVNVLPPLPSATCITRFFFQISATSVPSVLSDTTWFAHLIGSLHAMPQLIHLTLDLQKPDFIPPEDLTHTALPHLLEFTFVGLGDHLEELTSRFSVPELTELDVDLLDSNLDISIVTSFRPFTSHLTELKLTVAHLGLTETYTSIKVWPFEARTAGSITFRARHLDEDDVENSVVVVSEALGHIFSDVDTLILGFGDDINDGLLSRLSNQVSPDIDIWQSVFSLFEKVTDLRIDSEFTADIAEVLNDEDSTGLLPELNTIKLIFCSDDRRINPCVILRGYEPFADEREDKRMVMVTCEVFTEALWFWRHAEITHRVKH
ncbi:hypothetical protein BC834DRAFT_909383 [Gloeopeniophorella convolvens]|nr:hypothetical protein BC834DRAFT_909383 [Gloeopeniophorella convolvens]